MFPGLCKYSQGHSTAPPTSFSPQKIRSLQGSGAVCTVQTKPLARGRAGFMSAGTAGGSCQLGKWWVHVSEDRVGFMTAGTACVHVSWDSVGFMSAGTAGG